MWTTGCWNKTPRGYQEDQRHSNSFEEKKFQDPRFFISHFFVSEKNFSSRKIFQRQIYLRPFQLQKIHHHQLTKAPCFEISLEGDGEFIC